MALPFGRAAIQLRLSISSNNRSRNPYLPEDQFAAKTMIVVMAGNGKYKKAQ